MLLQSALQARTVGLLVFALVVAAETAPSGRAEPRPAACKIEDWEQREIKSCSRLFLHYAELGDDGATELAEALRGSQVTSISLFGCGIGDRGAVALAAAMEQTHSPVQLEVLNLGGNRIGDEGAVALGHALQVYAGLKELNLSDNAEITDVGVKAIVEGLDPAYTACELKTLNLWGVRKMSRSGVVALTQACETHHSLVTLIVPTEESTDPALVKRMQTALGRNKKMKLYGLDAKKTPVTMSSRATATETNTKEL